MSETKNIMDGLFEEMNRVRELIKEYEAIGTPGMFAAAFMKISIQQAERAIRENDVVKMLYAYKDLKSHTG